MRRGIDKVKRLLSSDHFLGGPHCWEASASPKSFREKGVGLDLAATANVTFKVSSAKNYDHRRHALSSASPWASKCGCAFIDAGASTLPVVGHHIGTARMSESPSAGVVNAHGHVYDLENVTSQVPRYFPLPGKPTQRRPS
jgi:hypothetical protein